MSATVNTEERQDTTAQECSCASRATTSPEVNIFETQDGYTLEVEVPGVSKSGVDITVEDNVLTITGRREKLELNAEAIYRESSDADYRRAFALDPAIDTARIDAKVEQGILTVRLPKSERAKPRKVTVND